MIKHFVNKNNGRDCGSHFIVFLSLEPRRERKKLHARKTIADKSWNE
jgi:hypothetical protein